MSSDFCSNMIGKEFGRLTVIGLAERKGYVYCKCICGCVKSIRANSLTKIYKPTRSCGCLHVEFSIKNGEKSIRKNASKQVATNLSYHTNFQVIESKKPPKNNKSGVKGVSWCKSRGMWEAYITVQGQRIPLGRRVELKEAIALRKEAEVKYFKPLIEAKNSERKRTEC